LQTELLSANDLLRRFKVRGVVQVAVRRIQASAVSAITLQEHSVPSKSELTEVLFRIPVALFNP
jgi:hypothetical protein